MKSVYTTRNVAQLEILRERRGEKEMNDEEEEEARRRKTRRRSKVEEKLPARPEQC